MISSTTLTVLSLVAASSGLVHAAPAPGGSPMAHTDRALAERGGPTEHDYGTEHYYVGVQSFDVGRMANSGGQRWEVITPAYKDDHSSPDYKCTYTEGKWPNALEKDGDCTWYRVNAWDYKICPDKRDVVDRRGIKCGECRQEWITLECGIGRFEITHSCKLLKEEWH